MYRFDSRNVIVCVIIGFVFINCGNDSMKDQSESDKEGDITPEDLYSFVALIDLVLTDGMRKSCTGTIIHDYVVITAAHCLKIDDDNIVQTELTASFVVIGTKKMFDTGYEQYLPIERVIIHPNYSGWTADLALVYTFAGMMSDKPGLIVPLASEKTITPVDSEVTVFSWGQFEINRNGSSVVNSKIEKMFDERKKEPLDLFSPSSQNIETSEITPKQIKKQRQHRKKRKNRKRIRQKIRQTKPYIENREKYNLRQSSTGTRYKFRHRPSRYGNIVVLDREAELLSWENKKGNRQRFGIQVPTKERYRSSRKTFRATTSYRNKWRRKTEDQQNKLAVESFGFINMQMCKKLVERAMPSLYKLKNTNEVLCYASEALFVTEKDSGAPAMRRGRLVAVTVGGVNYEGERVAVGLKMACFCSWISDNLPVSGNKLHCCKNCCESKDDAEQSHLHFKHRHNIKIGLKT